MPVPAGALWAWHTRPGPFERLTPAWELVVLLDRTGERLEDGPARDAGDRISPEASSRWGSDWSVSSCS